MKITFNCEKCGKQFYNQQSCENHEKECLRLYPIKLFLIDNEEIKDNNIQIYIYEYNHAIKVNDKKINFAPHMNYIEPVEIEKLQLDNIIDIGEVYGLYTTDFDKNNEPKYINKLIEYKKSKWQYHLDNIIPKEIKETKYTIEVLNNKKYKINRKENYTKLISIED